MKKITTIISLFFLMVTSVFAQRVVKGTVTDSEGKPISGVEFFTSGDIKRIGMSDEKGKILLDAVDENAKNLHYLCQNPMVAAGNVSIASGNTFQLVIDSKQKVVALGRNITSNVANSAVAFGTVESDDLEKGSDISVIDALKGRISGLQIVGDALKVRGSNTFSSNNPLVLIDGIARDINDVSVSEIENVTVLKDATAAAIYGTRGANGVISITTKRGFIGKKEVNVRYQYDHLTPFRAPEMVDAATYAGLYNEALANDGLAPMYSADDIAAFKSGALPNTDWAGESFNDFASRQVLDMAARGGTDKFRYFTSVVYSNQKDLFKHNGLSDREDYKLGNLGLSARTNIDVNLYKNTRFSVNIVARLNENRQPFYLANENHTDISKLIYGIPASAFPVYSPNGTYASTNFYGLNPVAIINDSGFKKDIAKVLQTDFRLYQDLGTVLDGLSAEAAISYDTKSVVRDKGSRSYAYEVLNNGVWTSFSEDTPMSFGDEKLSEYSNNNLEAKLNYNNYFGNTSVDAALVYQQESTSTFGRNKRFHRQSVMATANLVNNHKYLLNAVVNYAGSSVLEEGDQFRVFPAVALGWIASNEDFMSDSFVNYLKVRASAGVNGSDNFDHDLFIQNYLGGGRYFFTDNISGSGGVHEGDLPAIGLNYEMVKKANLGFDLELLDNRLAISSDVFFEHRENILVEADKTVSGVLGVDVNKQIDGIVENKGIEVTTSWNDQKGDFKYGVSGNFSFVRSKIVENNEGFLPHAYLSKIGNSLGADYGLEALGFFADEADIANSPMQMFGTVKPGDIKYKDQNNDNVIDGNDKVILSNSGTTPEIYFGLQLNMEFRNVGFSANIQGVANRSVYTSAQHLFFPLINGANISEYYASENVHWTEATKATATLPRLTTVDNPNNFQKNSMWIQDGNFVKLRNVELYYILDGSWLKGNTAKLFVRGADLLSFDNIKSFDPERVNSYYPSMSSVSVGAKFSF